MSRAPVVFRIGSWWPQLLLWQHASGWPTGSSNHIHRPCHEVLYTVAQHAHQVWLTVYPLRPVLLVPYHSFHCGLVGLSSWSRIEAISFLLRIIISQVRCGVDNTHDDRSGGIIPCSSIIYQLESTDRMTHRILGTGTDQPLHWHCQCGESWQFCKCKRRKQRHVERIIILRTYEKKSRNDSAWVPRYASTKFAVRSNESGEVGDRSLVR